MEDLTIPRETEWPRNDVDGIDADAIENQVVAVGAAADIEMLVARHQRIGAGRVGQGFAFVA
jgi:hypothetical protein